MGGKGGGGASPRPPDYSTMYDPPGREVGLTDAIITQNEDGTFTYGNFTADSRGELNRMIAAGGNLRGRRGRLFARFGGRFGSGPIIQSGTGGGVTATARQTAGLMTRFRDRTTT